MSAITDLFSSERGLFALVLVIAATVLAALGKMTVDSWQTFVQIVFGTYVVGKTVTSSVGLMTAHRRAEAVTATPAASSTPPAA